MTQENDQQEDRRISSFVHHETPENARPVSVVGWAGAVLAGLLLWILILLLIF